MIFLTVLAFSVTSMGWGIEGGSIELTAGKGHHGAIEASHASLQHEHGSTELLQITACLEADGSACEADADQQHSDASLCCAMACQIGMPVSECAANAIIFARVVEPMLQEVNVTEASASRLERPPRAADA
jgi:hypothetical protein